MKKPNARDFIAKLGRGAEAEVPRPQLPAELHVLPEAPRPRKATSKLAKPSRAMLKHFGGYLDDETLEKIALLRVRLKKNNSELIKLAIDELHSRQTAKRAFGDN